MQSPNLLFGDKVAVEEVGLGIKCQSLGHNDDIIMAKAVFGKGAEGYQHKNYHSLGENYV